MARIIAGATSSHVPAIGAAIDNGRTEEPYWKRVFSGFDRSKEWFAKTKPDVVIGVYNDHASASKAKSKASSKSKSKSKSKPKSKSSAKRK